MGNNYYILITCAVETSLYKLHIMLKLLTDQIENHSNSKEGKYIKIIECNDDIEIHIKRIVI